MLFELGVNVDLDRIKFLSRQKPKLDNQTADRSDLESIVVDHCTYYSWITDMCELMADNVYKHKIKAVVSEFIDQDVIIRLSGNGIDSNQVFLADIFGNECLENLKRQSQLKGIVQGLRVLIRDNVADSHIYCLKAQSLLNIKEISFKNELVLPADIKFPMILASIKGGTTFYRLDSMESQPIKIVASIFGEFTLAGIIKLVSEKHPQDSINKVLKRSILNGINLKVDLTVGDVYGGGVDQISGMHRDIIASSIGKNNSQLENPTDEDYVVASLVMFAINVANIGALIVR